ncbi:MAG: HD family phosphohydrolase, partial [Muribaculaceae bacterium]|nr:HD family phosphohydrolase [Muribaculaceae bacterium]
MKQYMENMNNKDRFIELLRSTGREGVNEVIDELESLGFFEAPASTRFHLNCEGGLLEHSLNVCDTALAVREVMIAKDESLRDLLPKDSVIIASLLHDTCKADIYKRVMKKRKNAFGVWEDVPGYDVDYSNFPMGHGEKSVIVLLCCGLALTDDEMMAIRWHMTAWDLAFQSPEMKGNLNQAKEICPLLTLIQAADGLAS